MAIADTTLMPVARPADDRKFVATKPQAMVTKHREGALLVVSGAGSGKTTTVAERFAAMVEEGVPVSAHLVMTFSRKGVDELSERIRARVSSPELSGQILTFHGFGWRFIRRFPVACGRQPGVTLLDERDQWKAFQAAATTTGVLDGFDDRKQAMSVLKFIRSQYSLVRNDCVGDVSELAERLRERLEDNENLPYRRIQSAIDTAFEYDTMMRKANLVDYDQLVLLPSRAMTVNEKAALWLQKRYPYLTVDEYQDTNRVQYAMIKKIGGHGNIVCVGDDDQVLFTWRGARAENIRAFQKDFDAKTAYLIQNFRSTSQIVDSAANLIACNSDRLEKRAFAEGKSGPPPAVVRTKDGYAMARGIASAISKALSQGVPPNEIAVLYRTNRMCRLLETDFRKAGIPYRTVGNRSLFDAPEVRAALGGVRLRSNHRDELALDRVCTYLAGIGATSAEAAAKWATDQAENPFLREEPPKLTGLPKRTQNAVMALWKAMSTIEEFGPGRVGAWALSPEGLNLEAALAEKPDDLRRVSANLVMFDEVNQAAIDAAPKGDDHWAVITETMLSDAAPENPDDSDGTDAVTLSTIHRAKGLEWLIVYVAGATDGLMPLKSAMEDDADDVFAGGLEEERRLAYVALTRARRNCIFVHAEELMLPGMIAPLISPPSPFLREMGLNVPAPWRPPAMSAGAGSMLSMLR